MPTFVELLLAYGICFGLQNKVGVLWGKLALLDAMLKCAYCTGFHAGWVAWVLVHMVRGQTLSILTVPEAILWAFSSSAFCYGVDVLLQLAESRTNKGT